MNLVQSSKLKVKSGKESITESFSFFQLLPFLIIVIYIAAIFFIKGRLPTPQDLLVTIKEWYALYGYYLVFFAAILEATFLLGLYVPGSTVILFGAAFSSTGVVQFPLIILLGTIGLLVGYTLNYFLGKYGWYHVAAKFGLLDGISTAQSKLGKHGGWAFLVGYIFPNSGAFLSTAAGVMKYPFRKFLLYGLLAQAFWSIVWGSVAYFIGPIFVELFMKYFGYVMLGIIGIFLVKKYFWKK